MQQAAGIFIYIRETLANMMLGSVGVDVTPDGLSVFADLMLAQVSCELGCPRRVGVLTSCIGTSVFVRDGRIAGACVCPCVS